MCLCGKEPETTVHYLLHCDFYSFCQLELHNDICVLKESLNNFLEEISWKFYFMKQKISLPRWILKF